MADIHLGTFLDILKYDATNLEETITTDLVHPLQQWNFPSSTGVLLRFVIDTESQDSDKVLNAYKQAWDMGARIKATDVYDAIGASMPTYADDVLQSPAFGPNAQGQDLSGQAPASQNVQQDTHREMFDLIRRATAGAAA